jgi:hypothetical protein
MAEKKPERVSPGSDEQRAPLQFLVEREELVRKFVLAEILGPPRAKKKRPGAARR